MITSAQFIPHQTDKEYWEIAQRLEYKVEAGEELSYNEIGFFCNGQKLEYLRNFHFCDDEFFARAHSELNIPEMLEGDIGYRRLIDRYKKINSLTDEDRLYYRKLVEEWLGVVNKGNHSDQLLQYYCKETREEIKCLKKDFKDKGICQSSNAFLRERFKIIEFSKYRYIITKGVFEVVIKDKKYDLFLNGIRISYNYYSLSHIITRHYGLIMKRYRTQKSHFGVHIHYESIHEMLEEVFGRIDNSGFFSKESVREINFKKDDIIYRVYCEQYLEGQKPVYRIATFFPIDESGEFRRLNEQFCENILERDFSVYTKK